MDSFVLITFATVYLGMVVGGIPGLALDRTGVALLGAIVLLATGRVGVDEAWAAIDVPTIGLLFGLMVLSAQFRLGGAYTAVTRHLADAPCRPGSLLGMVIASSAVLSALLANDIVCLAMAPLLVEGCSRRKLDPRPFVLALACASNIGSAATLIGNPQNMLIGQKLSLSFTAYLLDGVVPAAAGCFVLWMVLARQVRGRWAGEFISAPVEAPPFDAWQTMKGLIILAVLVVAFIATSLPREVLALAAAGVILLSRKMYSRAMLGLVDWQLLVLFISLFVVNHALGTSGMLDSSLAALREGGVDISRPVPLFVSTAALSNIVSNVPAVMLLLPAASHPQAGAIMALSSTLAGNLFIAGSIANIIVLDQAGRLGLRISWREHARLGIPVTLITLAIAAGWLLLLRPSP